MAPHDRLKNEKKVRDSHYFDPSLGTIQTPPRMQALKNSDQNTFDHFTE